MLTTIPDVFRGGYAGQNAYIHLGGNPIHCDSSLCWAKKPEYQQRFEVLLRLCQNENETSCYIINIISETSQCLNVCETQMIGSEDADDENSDDDTTSSTYSSEDIDSGVTVSLNYDVDEVTTTPTVKVKDRETRQGDDDDDDDDDDDEEEEEEEEKEEEVPLQ